ncbi:MAG: hypothetical protein WC121_10650 [Candidatus Kapaibacterium sp.]
MNYITEIVKVIRDSEIEQLGTGLDDLLIHNEGRQIANHLLINHQKTRIYIPSIWLVFKPAVVRYIKHNEHFTDKDIKRIASDLGIMPRTLRSALNEEEGKYEN